MSSDAFVDFDHSLNMAVMKLRDSLGDSTNVPLYIETIPKRGYRFIAPVSVIGVRLTYPVEISEGLHNKHSSTHPTNHGNDSEIHGANPNLRVTETTVDASAYDDSGVVTAAIPSKAWGGVKWSFRRRWLLATAVLAVCLASASWYLSRPLLPLRVTKFTQITHDGHLKRLVGTDGSRLYIDRLNDPQPIAQVAISGGEISPISVALPFPRLMDVSPDGSTLLIFSTDGAQGSLWSDRVLGGSLRHLADGRIASAAWSPDGKSVIYSTLNGEISIVHSDGTGVRRVASPEDHSVNSYPLFFNRSPDGRMIRFDWGHRLFEMSSGGSGLHPLLRGWHSSSLLFGGGWTPNGNLFEFLVWDNPLANYNTQGPQQLWALDENRGVFRRASTEPVQLTSGPIRWGRPYPSKDGKTIFASGLIARGELVRWDARSHQLQPYLPGISAEGVAFSPDGQFMLYVTYPDVILWKANRDGSNPMQLTDRPCIPYCPAGRLTAPRSCFSDRI